METLEKLFGSSARVKILRLFLFHPRKIFGLDEIKKRTRMTKENLRKELNLLERVGFVEKKDFPKENIDTISEVSKGRKAKKSISRKISAYKMDDTFPYIDQFRSILVNSQSLKSGIVKSKLDSSGKMKLVIAAGIFIGEPGSRVDLFIVGNKINKRTLETYLRNLEAEVGCELVYAVMDVEEYHYRVQVYDRLVRDVLEYPHERIIDRL